MGDRQPPPTADRPPLSRPSIEDGLADIGWANERFHALQAQRDELAGTLQASGEAPQLDARAAMAYRREVAKVLRTGTPVQQKRLLRRCVEHMEVAPERLEVQITYRVPEPLMESVVAGARSVLIHKILAALLRQRWRALAVGRHLVGGPLRTR